MRRGIPLVPSSHPLGVTKSHSSNFTRGQTGATYSIVVKNVGSAATSGTVTVDDTLPSGLTATQLSGSGWSCTLSPLRCQRSSTLNAGSSYPTITLKVNVSSSAPASVTNSATVSGGGDSNSANNTSNDPTTIVSGADLSITKSHSGNFTRGQTGAIYTITVTNVGGGATTGTVTVNDTLPDGLTAMQFSGSGWSCTTSPLKCTRSDSLASGSSYPPITLKVNVSSSCSSSVTNTATVSGGGDGNSGNNTANDPTTINGSTPDLTIAKGHTGNFTRGQTGATYTILVGNVGSAATSGQATVIDTLPTGLTATALSGSGWSCT